MRYSLYYALCKYDDEEDVVARFAKRGVDEKNIIMDMGFEKFMELLNESHDIGTSLFVLQADHIVNSIREFYYLVDVIRKNEMKLTIGKLTLDFTKKLNKETRAALKTIETLRYIDRARVGNPVKVGMEAARRRGAMIGRPKFTVDDLPNSFKHYYDLYTKVRAGYWDNRELSDKEFYEYQRAKELTKKIIAKYCKRSYQTVLRWCKIVDRENERLAGQNTKTDGSNNND